MAFPTSHWSTFVLLVQLCHSKNGFPLVYCHMIQFKSLLKKGCVPSPPRLQSIHWIIHVYRTNLCSLVIYFLTNHTLIFSSQGKTKTYFKYIYSLNFPCIGKKKTVQGVLLDWCFISIQIVKLEKLPILGIFYNEFLWLKKSLPITRGKWEWDQGSLSHQYILI